MHLILIRDCKNALHKHALRLVIPLPVTTKFAGKLSLQTSIGIRVRYVCPKVVPEGDMPGVFACARQAYIQVMLEIGSVCSERFTSADTQITSVLISHLG